MSNGGETLIECMECGVQTVREIIHVLVVNRGHEGDELLECRGPRGATIKIPSDARDQVVNRLHSAVAEHYASRLLSKPNQDKVFEVSSRSRVSNHLIRGSSFTRFANWLQGPVKRTSSQRRTRRPMYMISCRRCDEVSETLPHALSLWYIFHRNTAEAVLHCLWKVTRLPGVVRVN